MRIFLNSIHRITVTSPSLAEIEAALTKMNWGSSPELGGIYTMVLNHEGETLTKRIHTLI